ncbi:MAG: transporter [Gilvibacter sp.]
MIRFLLALILFASTSIAFGQDNQDLGDLITDRPDATESPNTMPAGFFQLETGAFYSEEETGQITTKATTFNTALLRYGILDNLELRLGWNFTEVTTEVAGVETPGVLSGFEPLLLGAKVAIAKENGWMPELGLLGHVYLPLSAGSDFRPETTGVDFRFSMAHTLNERSSIAYNLGAQWGDDSPEAAYVYTLAYGYSLGSGFGIYGELYGDLPEDSESNHYWDAGFTYLLNPNFQLDATIGGSVNADQNILISAGFSYRVNVNN